MNVDGRKYVRILHLMSMFGERVEHRDDEVNSNKRSDELAGPQK